MAVIIANYQNKKVFYLSENDINNVVNIGRLFTTG
jgi:hypothetical protein